MQKILRGNFLFVSMLTFPPNTVGELSVALPIVFRENGVVALSKPANIAIDEHPWNNGATTICGELRKRIAQNQPSAVALNIARPAAVLLTDTECSGLVLIADRASGALETWRNAAGSEAYTFVFTFLAKPNERGASEEMRECTLPVAPHFSESRAVISHKTGKKTETSFKRLEKFGEYELWQATTTFPRLHHVRLHAFECGLPIVGDPVYGDVPAIVNSAFKKKGALNKGVERPLYAPACIHLEKIVFSAETDGVTEIVAPLPDGFSALLKKLRARR